MLRSMHKELDMRHEELVERKISSIYFGGGTPSILEIDQLKELIDHTASKFEFSSDIEITLEANPDDLNDVFLKNLTTTAVNRLSIGTQSFYEPDLKFMNRAHTASEAESSIKRSQDRGFENLSIDLIYGSPISGIDVWKDNIEKTVKLQVPHISSYALTVEPKTALAYAVSKKIVSAPDDHLQSEEFALLRNELQSSGFEHYEISNFAKPGFHSRHNTSYWKNLAYLGIGPSAHGFDGQKTRSWNVANNAKYIGHLLSGNLASEKEVLTDKELFNEMIMIGLRTIWGVDLEQLKLKFPTEIMDIFERQIQQKIRSGHLIIEDNHLKIPKEKWFLADGIASDLFQLEE